MKLQLLLLVSAWVALCAALDGDSGSYYPDNSGQYVHDSSEGRYIPDNSGQYYPDYSGNYRDDGTGRYAGQKDSFGGSKFGAGPFGPGFGAGNLIGSSSRTVVRPATNPFAGSQGSATSSVGVRASGFGAGSGRYNDEGKWKILRQVQDIDGDGYHWEYLTENGINAEESGKLFNKGTNAEALRAQGFFTYTGPDNVVYYVSYTADENGFVPQGTHLPTPPPIPVAIQKSLDYQRATGQL